MIEHDEYSTINVYLSGENREYGENIPEIIKNLSFKSKDGVVYDDSHLRCADKDVLLLLHAEDFSDSSAHKRRIHPNTSTIDKNGKFGAGINIKNTIFRVEDIVLDGSFDFTIDWWEYQNVNISDAEGFIINREKNKYGLILAHRNASTVFLYLSINGSSWHGSVNGVKIGTPMVGEWVHRAFVYTSETGEIKCFENGKKTFEVAIGKSVIYSDNVFQIGQIWGSKVIDINIDEFRVTKRALWDRDFTPSQKPYTISRDKDTDGYRRR